MLLFSSYSVILGLDSLSRKPQTQRVQGVVGLTQLNLSTPREIWQSHKSASRLKSHGALIYVHVRLSRVQLGYFTVPLQGSTWWTTSAWGIFWEPGLTRAKVPMFALAPCPLYSKQSKFPSTIHCTLVLSNYIDYNYNELITQLY